jgi:uncharacterized membrane protein
LLPALFIELRWIIVSAAHPNASVASRESTFLEAFPSFFTSAKILLFICLVCSVAAVIFASRSFNQRKIVWRISSFVVVFIASIIALLSIFQMM